MQTRRKQSVTTERGAATKARIMESASALVASQGVAGTTLDQIMEATGASKSQLYHYFSDRDALMCAVVRAQSEKVLEFQEICLSGVASPRDLKTWRNQIVKLNRANGSIGGCPMGSLASELAERSGKARKMLAVGFERWESMLASAFKTMQEQGTLTKEADPSDLATAVVAALQGGLLLAQTARSSKPLELALDMALKHVEAYSRT